jgi:hypothetical protein
MFLTHTSRLVSRFLGAVGLAMVSAPTQALAQAPLPQLRWDQPVWCAQDRDNRRMRLQCRSEEGQRKCLIASDCLGNPGPKERCQPLERAQHCRPAGRGSGLTIAQLEQEGAVFEKATAEAPSGWVRDAGRPGVGHPG